MRCLTAVIILFAMDGYLVSQPAPGDLYKEYAWYNKTGDCGGALRVGGRLDYQLLEKADNYIGDGLIQPGFDIDLKNAISAEINIEKMLCHGGTEGLRIIVNEKHTVPIPDSENIPQPQSAYAHHFNALVPVDLAFLKPGIVNTFSFEVDTAGHWWPQNLV